MMSNIDVLAMIPKGWSELKSQLDLDRMKSLNGFLTQETKNHTVFPPKEKWFSALACTALSDVKVVILGQDPYHDDNQAEGLSFSVQPGTPWPPSLKNIFQELNDDWQHHWPQSGSLRPWAKQGVLLLNTVLTVRAHEAGSHQKQGWEHLTDAVIQLINQKKTPVMFLLWGRWAQQKQALINQKQHGILTAAHPSPLSAYRGFYGSKPFSKTNQFLKETGQSPINWTLTE